MFERSVPLAALFVTGALGHGQTFTGIGGAIPDDGTWYEYAISVSGLPSSIDTSAFGLEQVCITVEHSWIADLDITLVAPDGTSALLVGGNGGDQDHYTNTCFRADAGASITTGAQPYTGDWLPMQQMGVVNNGQDPNGTWKLRILDTYPFADAGDLFNWSLTFGSDPATYFSIVGSNLPIVIVSTTGAIPDEPKVEGLMGIINNGPGNYNLFTDPFTDYNGRIGIEIRGNSSTFFPKKSYGLELWDADDNDTSVAVLGMPAESDWVLSANYTDKSLLNNAITFHVGRALGHWAPRTQHVELFLNSNYMGTYVFMEKIKRDGDRVDIANLDEDDLAGDSLTGGYIVKIDWLEGSNSSWWASSFPPPNAPGNEIIEFILDDPEQPEPAQEDYIRTYIDSFETALDAPTFQDPQVGYAQYIDQRSFIDFLIVNELARNVDGYRLSTFLHKDKDSKGGRLTMGPLWDFDIAWFNADYCGGSSFTGWAYNINYDCPGGKMVPFWWWRLLEDPAFTDSLRCRWDALRSGPLHTDSLIAWVDSMGAYLHESQGNNFQLWPILGSYVWPNPWPLPTDYEGELQELRVWIALRSVWLDLNWPQMTGSCLNVGLAESWPGEPGLRAFPNPFTDRATLLGLNAGEHIRADLLDALGRHVSSTADVVPESRALEWTAPPALPPGTYILRLSGATGVRTIPVVKQ